MRLISCTVTVTEEVSGAQGLQIWFEVCDRNKPQAKKTGKRNIRDIEEHPCEEVLNTGELFSLGKE